MEVEIENLSWKVERAETTHTGVSLVFFPVFVASVGVSGKVPFRSLWLRSASRV